ncbi:hypothetical protein KZ844_30010, partial [Pseudomonas aeruginosa]|uniref:hypothetical protein n=2 Tax=Pseudomonas aeruginosa TaxID=287 RepID=UPI001CA4EEFB
MSPLPASPALNSLLRLLREGAPLVERVGALRRLLLEHPGTRQAWYLAWQPQAQTYTPVSYTHLRAHETSQDLV